MSEKLRKTNEWLGRVQQLRAEVDALRSEIHPIRVSCERLELPEWDDLDDAHVHLGDVDDVLKHVEDALKHLLTVPDTTF